MDKTERDPQVDCPEEIWDVNLTNRIVIKTQYPCEKYVNMQLVLC